MCVCVCVCVWLNEAKKQVPLGRDSIFCAGLHTLLKCALAVFQEPKTTDNVKRVSFLLYTRTRRREESIINRKRFTTIITFKSIYHHDKNQ